MVTISRHGNLMGRPPKPLAERMAQYTDTSGECHLWTGTTYKNTRYGYLRAGGRLIKAHRLAYELAYGPIPDGKMVLHKCDVRRCVNPAHLFLGTHKENMADMAAKGRAAKGDDNAMRRIPYRLNREVADIIRLRLYSGESIYEVAPDYDVSPTMIYRIKKGIAWA
jgi:hypothetical protein